MLYHIQTGQMFASQRQAQATLKILAPPLEPVTVLPRPEITAAQVATRDDTPEFINGEWVLGWNVRGMTAEELTQARQTWTVDRGTFALRAYGAGLVTAQEAEAWAGGTALPAIVTTAFEAITDPTERLAARIDALTVPSLRRMNPLILLLQSNLSLTDAQVDALFGLV